MLDNRFLDNRFLVFEEIKCLIDKSHIPSIEMISVFNKKIQVLPDLINFSNLVSLYCCNLYLTYLPALPPSLQRIYCSNNKLISLPSSLPYSLIELDCSENNLVTLPSLLPYSLKILSCRKNKLIVLPQLPIFLIRLYCQNNQLTSLPHLNATLIYLNCENNNIKYIPSINISLKQLNCLNNPIKEIIWEPSLFCNCFNAPVNNIIRKNNEKYNRFRERYFLSKFKKKILSWMWKTREERIKMEFHPEKLLFAIRTFEDPENSDELNQWLIKNKWVN